MDESFNIFGEGNNPMEILKMLLNKDSIEVKTRMSWRKLRISSKIKWFAILKTESLKPLDQQRDAERLLQEEFMPYYFALLESIDGWRSEQIITALKDMNDKFIQEQQGLVKGFGQK